MKFPRIAVSLQDEESLQTEPGAMPKKQSRDRKGAGLLCPRSLTVAALQEFYPRTYVYGSIQLRITFPDCPDIMTSKPFWNSV